MELRNRRRVKKCDHQTLCLSSFPLQTTYRKIEDGESGNEGGMMLKEDFYSPHPPSSQTLQKVVLSFSLKPQERVKEVAEFMYRDRGISFAGQIDW